MHFGKKALLAILTLSLSCILYAQTNREQAIIDRVAPVGTTCMVGDACASESSVSSSATAARSPEDIYNSNCMACHMTGASDAPILGNVEQWAPRIANGMEVLYSNAVNGLNAMPAKGLCMSCSDEDIHAVVDYMVENSQ
jgi:cytochrome c5